MLSASVGGGIGPTPKERPFWRHAVEECAGAVEWMMGGWLPEWGVVFEMARNVRGHSQAETFKPVAVALRVYRECREVREVFDNEEDFAQQFATAWGKVRVLPGHDLLASAARMAVAHPVGLRKEHQGEVTPGYVRFIAFCGHLCVGAGTDRIKLPCREVGEALGVAPKTVSCYRQQAVEHGYLTLIKPHRYQPQGKGEATLFRFRIELWECFQAKLPASA